jgi:thymidylate synthase (FAD)
MKLQLLDHFGDDLMVVNAARVSMKKFKTEFDEADVRLIRYLAKHNHITPFFHPQVSIRVHVPIFVARQWFRSVIGTARNEVSRRYVDDAPEFFTPDWWRQRPEASIKQGSGGPVNPLAQYRALQIYEAALYSAESAYKALLDLDIAPEQARMVLPQSMYTTWIETGSLAFWARFYKLRAEAHAQLEIQECAAMVDEIIRPLFPVSWDCLTCSTLNES